MDFNLRMIDMRDRREAAAELTALGCDAAGTDIMSDKAVFRTIKAEHVSAKAANLLKQAFLAHGGEAAICRGCANLSVDFTDVIICATIRQYHEVIPRLKLQPWGLSSLATALEKLLTATADFPCRHYSWPQRDLRIEPYHTIVMGILNVTPDSFSDGGKYNDIDAALYHAEQMVVDGAEIIDIGAESTRPYNGAERVSATEEQERLLPILERLVKESPVPVSVDTYKACVAEEALKLGAHIINDVWGLQYDDGMAAVAARYHAPVVVMHNSNASSYPAGVMSDVLAFLRRSIDIGIAAGMDRQQFIVDPGIGFAKDADENLLVMKNLCQLRALGCPVLLGTSRKRFIGAILGTEADDRVEGTGATVACGIMQGVNIIRVHDVKSMVRQAKVTDAIMRGMVNG